MKKLITFLIVLITFNAYSETDPPKSNFDYRVRELDYNNDDVTKIIAVDGYTTTIKFSDNEYIQYVTTGFEEGWQHKIQNNYLIIMPKPIDNGEGTFYKPSSPDWNTNLIVITDRREYSFQLMIDEKQDNNSFIVRFNYPKDRALAIKNENIRKAKIYQEEKNKQLITKSLGKLSTPVNWNYYKSVNKGSESIVPDFVYDDGILTFLGFSNEKEIPSVFLVNKNKSEEMLTYNMRADVLNNYRTLVVHKVAEKLILRNGNKVVGIFNQSYGTYKPEYKTTISDNVIRVINQ
ncbi:MULTISPECIES: P-type conjugative transfer protein VirB9 [unclassified Gilliamella]|uniref:P-type conjugative transfer protein VirB9 n=1 Tax=unclassified Gilliamella TaxID=2685620 RepID=UPI00226A4EBC|nr:MULTISPECIES: P-type conjugative transfer protein VirB9 [unclassified Gilliamella]MCX8573828.1 P-type conjugative transfer protein VirB9 [Gilliamella sp. B3831]MCX8576059.1 P-type conjugative transfer protein VirB9 [Gilliamella sp. B3815]MCX8590568.1 P-type conjugative transfer protein VirB9 [Gilliamella sp. B3812]MCX8603160.1 P-type conjugative transfer protein VirB9 [Gilliamella sp. B3823]MCX8605277.1 P-type conjugative transfer protein VirB9 [Gilliamella sp. B3825]